MSTIAVGSFGTSQTPIIAAGAGSVWLASINQGTVSRIDPTANRVVATIALGAGGGLSGRGPSAVAAGEEGVWVAIFG